MPCLLGPRDKSILNTGTAVQRMLGGQQDRVFPHFTRRPCCLLGARSPFVSPSQHRAGCGPTLHFQPGILRARPDWKEGAVGLLFLFSLLILFNRCRERSFAEWGLDCTTGWPALCPGWRPHQYISPSSSSHLSGPQPGCFAVWPTCQSRESVFPCCVPRHRAGLFHWDWLQGSHWESCSLRAARSISSSGHSPKGAPSQDTGLETSIPLSSPSFATGSLCELPKSLHLPGPQFPLFQAQCCTESSAAPGILEVQGGPGRTSTSWRDAASAEGPPPPPAG